MVGFPHSHASGEAMPADVAVGDLEGSRRNIQRVDPCAFEFPDPAVRDFRDGHWIQVVQFLPASLHRGDEVGLFEDSEVLRDGLAGHLEA